MLAYINACVEKYPLARGPQLARLDFYANLLKNGGKIDNVYISNILHHFFVTFGSKPICALDIAYVIHMVLSEKSDQAKVSSLN